MGEPCSRGRASELRTHSSGKKRMLDEVALDRAGPARSSDRRHRLISFPSSDAAQSGDELLKRNNTRLLVGYNPLQRQIKEMLFTKTINRRVKPCKSTDDWVFGDSAAERCESLRNCQISATAPGHLHSRVSSDGVAEKARFGGPMRRSALLHAPLLSSCGHIFDEELYHC